ncbi:lysophospholipid acyltransferase family protein [Parasphingorhabdus cellanae]|uniref:1-acyl-sn-glycerol-3-phosphate acyltransferase n=1 Tax=Parasphingorhabdus cellanae TaxID=2806553 RepID=A0ABX7T7U7_9SPHN|nr:lysophospholipid acyltransferase family protein [Parasphingorhabdus cellanae]QTD56567.1 1-acyl-sn-glycerol-3-phosphate acyltransferase [Parasphingorhabdus cellanae]
MAYPLTERASANQPLTSVVGALLIGLRTLGILLSLLICLPMHYLWRLLRLPSPWPRFFLQLVATNCGAVIKTKGNRLKHDVFYVSNHISWFDIPVVAGVTGCTFVAQDGIASWPIIGWLCRINKTIFVSRTDRMQVGDQIDIIREAIEEKYPITVFPEGTTTDGHSLLPFKPSLFQAMAPPPKPTMIQPVLLDYGDVSKDIAWVGDESAVDNAKRLFGRWGIIPTTLHFIEPFDPADFGDRKAICAEAERRIAKALSASLSGEPVV